MASQAVQIAKQIVELKREVQGEKLDSQALAARWKSLQILVTQAGKPKELWKNALTKDVLQCLLDAATSTMQQDKTGISSTSVGNTIEATWAALESIADQLGQADIGRINIFVEGTIGVADAWWTAYKDVIPTWKKSPGAYEPKSEAITSAFVTMHEQVELVPETARASLKRLGKIPTPAMQEMVLAEMALGYNPDSEDDQPFYRLAFLSGVLFGHPKIEGFPAPVAQPSDLARRFNQNADPSRASAEDLTRIYGSLYCLLAVKGIGTVLKSDDQLCVTVASGLWKWYEECNIMPIPERNKIFARIASVVAQLFPGKPEQMAARFETVMRQHDFISVIIKLLYAFGKLQGPLDTAPGLETEHLWKHWEDLKVYIVSKPALFKAPLQSVLKGKLLDALDIIRCNRGTFATRANKYLEELGTFAGLNETELRKAAIAERQKAQGGIVGCSWYRCVLYRQATDQVMNWCAGCRKVVYCGYLCQSRDWEEGHKDECQARF
ncbi:hypothetical protein FS837_012766 [Tulasnella sp. UAMH 9824]|nr:hypothetical protein FS837_012766 [Tulasnella sp. UAMH 9824]